MNLFFEIALFLTPGIGNINYKQLIKTFINAEEVFRQSHSSLRQLRGLGPKLASNITAKSSFTTAEHVITQAQRQQATIYYYLNSDYPRRLLQYPDSPVLLFGKGNMHLNPKKAISIVGTRNITAHGIKTARNIIAEIASYSPQVISGLAYGTDIEAHKSALKNDLSTIGIMGSGLDNIYPKTHTSAAIAMQGKGGLLTEQLFGAKPEAPNFPARNRIIAGMSDAVIVIEAAHKGGALITAKIANSYGVEVLACPGRISDNYNSGCNLLIENHEAHIYTSVRSLINLLNWDIADTPTKLPRLDLKKLSEPHRKIITALQKNNQTKNELTKLTAIPLHLIPTSLLELELKGLIEIKTGGLYAIA